MQYIITVCYFGAGLLGYILCENPINSVFFVVLIAIVDMSAHRQGLKAAEDIFTGKYNKP